MLNGAGDKSPVDDSVASRYCKCESSLCCYEALRFILCFYDLFFLVSKLMIESDGIGLNRIEPDLIAQRTPYVCVEPLIRVGYNRIKPDLMS